jgi:hypothetical protein
MLDYSPPLEIGMSLRNLPFSRNVDPTSDSCESTR